MSNILFILSNPFFFVIILNRSTNFLFKIYHNPPPPPPPHTHTHTPAALDDFSKTTHFVFRSDKNFVGQTNFHILSDRMSCKVLATFVNTAGNGTLTSLCGFSRKFSFSVDLNLKKGDFAKILGSIFIKTFFTQHMQSR